MSNLSEFYAAVTLQSYITAEIDKELLEVIEELGYEREEIFQLLDSFPQSTKEIEKLTVSADDIVSYNDVQLFPIKKGDVQAKNAVKQFLTEVGSLSLSASNTEDPPLIAEDEPLAKLHRLSGDEFSTCKLINVDDEALFNRIKEEKTTPFNGDEGFLLYNDEIYFLNNSSKLEKLELDSRDAVKVKDFFYGIPLSSYNAEAELAKRLILYTSPVTGHDLELLSSLTRKNFFLLNKNDIEAEKTTVHDMSHLDNSDFVSDESFQIFSQRLIELYDRACHDQINYDLRELGEFKKLPKSTSLGSSPNKELLMIEYLTANRSHTIQRENIFKDVCDAAITWIRKSPSQEKIVDLVHKYVMEGVAEPYELTDKVVIPENAGVEKEINILSYTDSVQYEKEKLKEFNAVVANYYVQELAKKGVTDYEDFKQALLSDLHKLSTQKDTVIKMGGSSGITEREKLTYMQHSGNSKTAERRFKDLYNSVKESESLEELEEEIFRNGSITFVNNISDHFNTMTEAKAGGTQDFTLQLKLLATLKMLGADYVSRLDKTDPPGATYAGETVGSLLLINSQRALMMWSKLKEMKLKMIQDPI